jgi:hypothetical protein
VNVEASFVPQNIGAKKLCTSSTERAASFGSRNLLLAPNNRLNLIPVAPIVTSRQFVENIEKRNTLTETSRKHSANAETRVFN